MAEPVGYFTEKDATAIADYLRRFIPRPPAKHGIRNRKRLARGSEPSNFIPCDFTLSGGSDGDETTQASWLYDIRRYGTTEVLMASVPPNSPPHKSTRRGSKGSIVPATFGWIFYDGATLIVADCNETRTDEACP